MNGKIVVVKNNGLTSFVSPCFSWELLDDTNKQILTASEVNLSKLKLTKEKERETLDSLYRGELRVKGHISKVEAEDLIAEEGIRFTIDEIVGPTKVLK